MFKKILLLVIVSLLLVNPSFASENADIKMINAINYHKGMFNAAMPEVFLKIPFGAAANNVGGDEQDPEHYSSGVPFAFRSSEDGVWVLDSVNKALKLFAKDGKALKNISLAAYGELVKDFAFAENGFWLLSQTAGYIYRIDQTGKLLSEIEGFSGARAIETGPMGELLVDMPVMGSILRFAKDETLKKQYPCDESLSLIEGLGGKLIVIEMQEKLVKLQLRDVASPTRNIHLAEFPLDIEDPAVKYVGAQVVGTDSDLNIYLSLTACHEISGAIYRDRIYRCSPAGQVLASKDILLMPGQPVDLPRDRVVTTDGQVMTFYVDGNAYVLAVYRL